MRVDAERNQHGVEGDGHDPAGCENAVFPIVMYPDAIDPRTQGSD